MKKKYLVFTSAGENANMEYWCNGTKSFDIWVVYYGNNGQKYRDLSDYYNTRSGSKFQNLSFIYRHYYQILLEYESIFVLDDDILINTETINELFEIRNKYNLWVLQPAFDPAGKISHPITQVNPACQLRYTNFVEVTCPLFRRDKLDYFMLFYDPVLVGWGIDWWFLDVLGPELNKRVAIVDQWPCINPRDYHKIEGQREINRLQLPEERWSSWLQIKKKYNVTSDDLGFCEYAQIQNKSVQQEAIFMPTISNTQNFASEQSGNSDFSVLKTKIYQLEVQRQREIAQLEDGRQQEIARLNQKINEQQKQYDLFAQEMEGKLNEIKIENQRLSLVLAEENCTRLVQEREVQNLQAERKQMEVVFEEEINILKHRLHAMRLSLSWRITTPLRKLTKL